MRNFLKYFLAAGAVLSVLLISEAIYSANNRPEFIQTFYLILAKREASSNNIQKSLNYMSLATRGVIYMNAKRYPDYIQRNYSQLSYNPNNENFQKDYRKYFENLPNFILIQDRSYSLSRIFYDLGVLAYQNKEKNQFPIFVKVSYHLDPSLSYWPIELSNYYYSVGQKEKAFEILNECQKNVYPKKECSEYENFLTSEEKANTPGFLLDETAKFYNLPSVIKTLRL